MDKIQLKASVRNVKESSVSKLRKTGLIPAVLYGHKVKNTPLAVSKSEFEKALKKAGESTIVELVTDDGKTHPVLIHEVQQHYLTSQPIHIDFYEVSMTEKLKADVALEFVGESKAVKELGGVLVKVLSSVTVQCLPADLPHNLPVDITQLQEFSSVIHVKDIPIPQKVELLTLPEEVVVKVQPPRDVEAELATPVVEDVSKVEGAAEEKPAVEGEAAAQEKQPKEEKKEKKE